MALPAPRQAQLQNRRRVACLLLAAATLICYWPLTRCDFISFDDPQYVTQNPVVSQGLTSQGIAWAFRTSYAGNWHPLTWLSHMLDVQLFGLRPAAHHLVNLAFHIANTLILFLLLAQLTGRLWRSAFVAALFALHPLHVESVAWVSERKDVLSTFFGLLAIWAYVESRKQKAESGNRGPSARATQHASRITFHVSPFYLLSLALFALSLMSKPMLVTLPFVLLLLDYWPLGRMKNEESRMQNAEPGATRPSSLRWFRQSLFFIRHSSFLILEKLPFLALSAASSVITFLVQKQVGTVASLDLLSPAARLSHAAVSYILYLEITVWPDRLAAFYPLSPSVRWQGAPATLLLALISIGVVLARRRPWLPVGWFWFLGMLLPVIGLVQVGAQAIADRYTYLPLVGLFIAVVWSLAEALASRANSRTALGCGAAVLLLSCAALTRREVLFWQNSETLFRRALQVTRDNHLAYDALGTYYAEQGRTTEAVDNLRKSLALRRRFEPLHNLGLALASQGNYTEAIPLYRESLQLRPNETAARKNLAYALVQSGQCEAAVAEYRSVLQAAPGDLEARNSLGIALTMQRDLEEAVRQFREVLRADRNEAGAHGNLAYALMLQHKYAEAIEEYREVLRLNPSDARAQQGLEKALAEQGNP
jgi:protein O-mannosyl-transferase